MKTTKATDKFGQVVKKLKPLRAVGPNRIDVRLIDHPSGVRRLDIRQHITSERYTGYTRKGVSLSAEEWEVLNGERKTIAKFLNA